MATIYDISFGLCSPYCSYSESELKIISKIITGYPETGLGFDPVLELEVTKRR